MSGQHNKYERRQIRRLRIRRKVEGTVERPRLSVFRSARHIYAQIIDDARGVTLATASSREELPRPGTGVIAGSGVRAVLEVAGVQNVLTKCLGSRNPHNIVKATVNALQRLRRPSEVAAMRGINLDELFAAARTEVEVPHA